MLYLQPHRTPALLTAQAEYQARILPALADQLRLETSHCGHARTTPVTGRLSPATLSGHGWGVRRQAGRA